MDRPNRMKLQSADGAQLNLDALYQIAPSCFTEVADPDTGGVKRVVNFDVLRQLLGDNAVEDAPEAYEFNWVGKQAARAEVLKPIKKTLRPVKEDSVDWDNTQNLYIEGDNLEVLKLLQKSYLGKVKMIYIDPPYNTGNDFVYHDDFAMSADEYAEASGSVDELGNKYIKNMDSNGRFHSDWCSMMYSRLMVARSLLSEDGVIFISIDDNEVENLRKICDELYGENNFVAQIIWRGGRRALAKFISTSHEYMLCFAKDLSYCSNHGVEWLEKKNGLDEIYTKVKELTKEYGSDYLKASEELKKWYKKLPDNNPSKDHKHYSWIDKRGVYFASDISRGGGGGPKWEIINPNTGNPVSVPARGWSYATKEALLKDIQNDLVHFNGDGVPCKKRYLKDMETQLLETVFYKDRRGSSKRLRALMGGDIFPFPKDEIVLQKFIKSFTLSEEEDIILDFFSGSSSTAHAVMQLNAEDGGNRKFIMVQLPEETPEDSEARKAGYNTIPDIAKERIRRAGKKIKEESPLTTADLDTGFRVFRLDEGNYEDVKRSPKEFKQDQLDLFLNNIKADRNDLDLLFGCMLDWGVQLSLPMTQEVVDGKTIYTVNDGDLVACFAENVSEDVVKAMAEKMPLRVIFRDSCFAQDADKINIYETFKQKLDWSDQEVVKNIRVI